MTVRTFTTGTFRKVSSTSPVRQMKTTFRLTPVPAVTLYHYSGMTLLTGGSTAPPAPTTGQLWPRGT